MRCSADGKPTRDFTPRLLRTMYTAGVRVLLWGVESGSQRVLDVIDKGTNIADMEMILRTSHEAGIWNLIFFIMGYPTQTKSEILEDIQFFKKNEPYISTIARSLFQLEVGSRIYENPQAFGITQVEKNPDIFSPVCQYTVSEGLQNREAERIYRLYGKDIMKLYRVSPYFGKLRDHMLLYADHLSSDPLKT